MVSGRKIKSESAPINGNQVGQVGQKSSLSLNCEPFSLLHAFKQVQGLQPCAFKLWDSTGFNLYSPTLSIGCVSSQHPPPPRVAVLSPSPPPPPPVAVLFSLFPCLSPVGDGKSGVGVKSAQALLLDSSTRVRRNPGVQGLRLVHFLRLN
jgi:hypothetical protein